MDPGVLPCRADCPESAGARVARRFPERKKPPGHEARAALLGLAAGVYARIRQPLATCSSVFGFSKNCSSSVEFLSAVVDAWLPWIVVVTASK